MVRRDQRHRHCHTATYTDPTPMRSQKSRFFRIQVP
jgi:hypothetical protein